jgi:hypothetical protein
MTSTDLIHASPVLPCAVCAWLDATACAVKSTPLTPVHQLIEAIGQGVIQ